MHDVTLPSRLITWEITKLFNGLRVTKSCITNKITINECVNTMLGKLESDCALHLAPKIIITIICCRKTKTYINLPFGKAQMIN